MPLPKTGPLTPAELQAIWVSTADPAYTAPFIQAGEGNGFEAHTQAWQQFARVSQAIDTTTQAMYILPWSGQSGPPASGPNAATVTLTISRTGLLEVPLILQAGTLVGEVQNDWSATGSTPVSTGRTYALNETLVFEPGQQGPLQVTATASFVGYGGNNPLPGSINTIQQLGTQYNNTDGNVRFQNGYLTGPIIQSPPWQVLVDCDDEADSFIPSHVGQYLAFTAGSNVGLYGLIVAYQAPNPPTTGGTVQIALLQSIVSSGTFGTFQIGESLNLMNGASVSGYGTLLDFQIFGGQTLLTIGIATGSAVTEVIGNISGATANVGPVLYNPAFTAEVGVTGWRILDWVVDWGITVTNTAQPVGGTAGFLDAIGKERNIPRANNEPDSSYRVRVAQLADTISPNAIRRALNRTIPGTAWQFLEAGTSYPGFYYDQDAYDYDAQVPTGTVSGTFIDCERVKQITSSGQILYGYARSYGAPPATVPGAPGSPTLRGFVGISREFPASIPSFVTGEPIVGLSSGASITPSALTGALSSDNLYRVYFDYLQMRAWFYVILPNSDLGDPGFAYDTHPYGAYDTISGFYAAYDGAAYGFARQNQTIVSSLNQVRAAGVGFTLVIAP